MNNNKQLKILRVINTLGSGGAERSVAANVPIHIRNGLDMDVLLLNGGDTPFRRELEEQGVRVQSVGLGPLRHIYNPLMIWKLRPFLRGYDIIHVHLFPAFYWVALAKMLSGSKARLVFTEHNTHNRRRANRISRYIDRFIYRKYEVVIAVTKATEAYLLDSLKIDLRTVVINNGVDLRKVANEAKVAPTETMEKLKPYKVLLQIAGFRAQKDQDTLIRSLPLLPKDYCACFVGDGERRKTCENLAHELGVSDRAFFFGIQENIGQFIREADIVVMSSHWEGFGRTAVEGMALAKPVVASNVSGLNEVVGGAGLLFDVGNAWQLADSVLCLMNNRAYYDTIASRCHERSKKYDILDMINGYEAVYRGIMDE